MQNRLNGGQCFGVCLRAFLLASGFRVSGLGGQRHIALRFRAFWGLGFVVHVLRRAFILNPTPHTLACARGGWGEATTRKPSSLKRGLGFRVPVLRILRMLRRRSTRISDRSDSSPRPFARNSKTPGVPQMTSSMKDLVPMYRYMQTTNSQLPMCGAVAGKL